MSAPIIEETSKENYHATSLTLDASSSLTSPLCTSVKDNKVEVRMVLELATVLFYLRTISWNIWNRDALLRQVKIRANAITPS